MNHIRLMFIAGALASTGSAFAAQPAILYSFAGTPDGAQPAGITFAAGELYGATDFGGTKGGGTLFMVSPANGAETKLYDFPINSQGEPSVNASSDLLVDKKTIYGTTYLGGTAGLGTLYSYDLSTGMEVTLHNFAGNSNTVFDGAYPDSGVISVGGLLYGVCAGGGNNNTYGTLFSFDPKTGTETTLYKFYTPGDQFIGEPVGPLVNIKGTLYGAATFGGANQLGGVFAFNIATGAVRTIYSFNMTTDLFAPQFGLTYSHGLLYGVLAYGGTAYKGVVFSIDPTTGAEKIVHQFSGGATGGLPDGRLLASGAKLFGNLSMGGKRNQGAVYEISLSTGAEKLLSSFPGAPGAAAPARSLAVSGRILYGTSVNGGTAGDGTVFQLKK